MKKLKELKKSIKHSKDLLNPSITDHHSPEDKPSKDLYLLKCQNMMWKCSIRCKTNSLVKYADKYITK